VTFSDSGAHVSQTIGSSVFTYLLDYWVRDKEAMTLEEAVRRSTFDTAAYWGLTGRGLLREGWAADIAIFDPAKVGPQLPTVDHDLPSGARRLKEKSQGLLATIVNGQVLMRNNEHTGALPGQLLRGSAHE
jgi:N-acyl-D-amino-acid deacylase